jgi:hypothetical protein
VATELTPGELFDGEELVESKNANAIVTLTDYGLETIFDGKLAEQTGMSGREGIGGKLHLTTWRLVFKSHSLNRLVGEFSIFLPTVTGAHDVSRGLSRKIQIDTLSQQFVFVLWGVPKFLAAIQDGVDALDSERTQGLWLAAAEHPEIIGADLQPSESVESFINGLFAVIHTPSDMARAAQRTVINLADLARGRGGSAGGASRERR